MSPEDGKRMVGRSKYADIPLPRYMTEAEAPEPRPFGEEGGGLAAGMPAAAVPPEDAGPSGPQADDSGAGSRYRRRPAAAHAAHAKPGIRARRVPPARAVHPVAVAACSIIAIVLAVVAIDAAANWERVYPGVKIGSVDVSGMTLPDAYDAIQEEYGGRVAQAQVAVYADEETLAKARAGEEIDESAQSSEEVSGEDAARARKVWRVDASSLEARLDAEAAVKGALAVGREDGGIAARISAQMFGRAINPHVQLNDALLEGLGADIDRAIGDPHRDCDLAIEYGEARVVDGEDGLEVDRGWLRERIEDGLLADSGDRSFAAYAQPAPMRIDRDAAQAAADRVNAGIASGAELVFGEAVWNASAHELGDLIRTRVEEDDGAWRLVPYYEESATKNAIVSRLQDGAAGRNLKVEFASSDGTMLVKTNADGPMPEAGGAVVRLEAATLGRASDGPTPRVEVDGADVPSAMSVQAALDYGIITTIAEYRTEYTGGATARNHNIHLAADLLDGSIIRADGGEWSFNGTAGECNEEKGFQGAGSIVNGETVDEIGGGICQVATTVFNAVFEAGYPVDQRRNHSLYIPSYPAGRDAAINWPDLDLVWHNDTGNDILMRTSWDDTTVTVSLVGVDPGLTVESQEGEFAPGAPFERRTVVDPALPEGGTYVRQTGQDGSSITVGRDVKDGNGQIVRHDEFVSVYDAKDEIIAVGAASGAAGD